jgi:hypothetical protein
VSIAQWTDVIGTKEADSAIVADGTVEVLYFDCERNPFTGKPFL